MQQIHLSIFIKKFLIITNLHQENPETDDFSEYFPLPYKFEIEPLENNVRSHRLLIHASKRILCIDHEYLINEFDFCLFNATV